MIADTSGLLALFNSREPKHEHIRGVVESLAEPLVVSPFVVAELDYLVATRLGTSAELAVLDELGGGAYDLPHLDQNDIQHCAQIVRDYGDQEIGIADASIVLLANRYETIDILTLDERHFRVLKSLTGSHFNLA